MRRLSPAGSRKNPQKRKNITRDAYALFIRKTGDDMENIDKELEKLLCYTLEKDYIDISDVEAITTEQTENKIFDMIDAVALAPAEKGTGSLL